MCDVGCALYAQQASSSSDTTKPGAARGSFDSTVTAVDIGHSGDTLLEFATREAQHSVYNFHDMKF